MIATLACPLVLLAAPQQGPAAFDSNRQSWSVGLVAVRVAALAADDWFGGPRWRASQVTFRAAGDEASAAVQVRQEDDFEMKDVRIRLTSAGAEVQIEHQSDVMLGALQDVGGVVCLATDGTDTRLEFELYELSGGYHVEPLAGSVALHGAGRALALELARRPTDPSASPLQTLVRVRAQEDQAQSHGYVDSSGRKQGVWVLSEADGRRMQLGWRDGIPHGTALDWDAQGRLRTLRTFRDGVQDGESMDWSEDGALRSCETFVRGARNGRRVGFHPNGVKSGEMELMNECQLGPSRRWSESGELVEELPQRGYPIALAQNEVEARCQARFDALHTHAAR